MGLNLEVQTLAIRRWIKARLGLTPGSGHQQDAAINLVDEAPRQHDLPELAGIDVTLVQRPWSASRLSAIVRNAQRVPSPATLQAARLARHCLSSFWLVAPVDQLEELYAGAIGEVQRRLLEGPLPQQPLARDEQRWRVRLAARLAEGTQAAQHTNLLLSLMPYFAPHTFTIDNPIVNLPGWLLNDYVVYCEPRLKMELEGPAGLLQAGDSENGEGIAPLSERRGDDAMAWFRDEEALSRMQALLNLYALDPNDSETVEELAALRRVAAQLWLDVDPNQLETLYRTPVGLITRSLITAGFGRELLNDVDVRARKQLAPRVEDLSQPDAVNALLAVLMFYPANKIELEDASGLPAWLQEELRSL